MNQINSDETFIGVDNKPWHIKENELDIPIWRYMDFSKYMDILETSTLFFSSINGFEDKLEGFNNSLTADSYFIINTEGDKPKIIYTKEKPNDDLVLENSNRLKAWLTQYEAVYKNSLGINCWRIDEIESHAMWKVYLKSNEGVAIKSSVRLIKESIELKGLEKLNPVKIQYIDYNNHIIDTTKTISSIYYKSNYFIHEKELRLLYNEVYTEGTVNYKPLPTPGINVPINTNHFINEVIVSPYAPKWFFELVGKVTSKYNLNVPVTLSGIQLRKSW